MRAEFTRTTNGMTVTIDGQEYGISLYPISCNPIPNQYVGKSCDRRNFSLNKQSVPTTSTQKDLYGQYKILYTYYSCILPQATEATKLLCELLWRNNIALNEHYYWLMQSIYNRTDITKADISKVITKLLNKEIDAIKFEDIEYEVKQRYNKVIINQLPIKSSYLKEKILATSHYWQMPKEFFDDVVKWQVRLVKDLKKTEHIMEEIDRFTEKTIPHYLQNYIILSHSSNYTLMTRYSDIQDFIDTYEEIDEYIRILNTVWNDNPMTYPELRDYRKELYQRSEDIREKAKEEEFKNRQSKLNNIWDNDNYKIIIPLTKEDCVKIGNKFHNCFGNHEWNYHFKNGERYGACVVDRANNPVICLDIDIRSRKIMQYLAPNNRTIHDKEILQLKEKIRRVLLKNIIKGDE